ncbi:origin recognition complex subunit 1 [Loa loa]|uniref:Origin recognition complex subunit 1 n=1 Tax=Loa loa TaxID=7209 RepID=A0A1I7W2B1_LOALO|nr:origin recognition complex subunit 1 [Loa loa]EFO19124.1 origin recognition complex subunit 1 [Loa loa]
MAADKDVLRKEKSQNTVSRKVVTKGEGYGNTSNRRILPKRKTKSMGRGYSEDLFVLTSPPNKRSRSSMALQQAKLIPAFNYGENLNVFGFESEYEDSKSDSENVKSEVLCHSLISLPLPSTATETLNICKKRVSVASEAWKSRRSSIWKQKIGTSDNIGHRNGFSLHKPIRLKNTVAHTGIDFTADGAGKIKSGSVNEGVDRPIKRIDGLHFNDCKKPLIILKRTKVLAGARFIDNEHDSSGCGSEDNDDDKDFECPEILESFSGPDSDSETNSNFRSVNRKIQRHQNNSVCESRRLIAEKRSDDKGTARGVISNVCPMVTFSTQRVETLEAVYRRLHTSEIPERLPCRETEFERICAFIKECIADNAISQAMYVSGVPGTGKTATVLQAVRHLKASKKFSTFDFVAVNAMELSDPKQIFVKIYQDLFNVEKKIAPKTARKKLNKIFQYRDRKRLPIIVLVDELDLLNTKKQEIIYDILNWSANEESLVNVIAIANTFDLPERLFSQRVSSRLGTNRLCFQPYDHNEVAYIIRDRLCDSSAVEAEAVELASRKVAAISGDLRKALDILRSATELAINANQKQLTMKNVQEAIRQASTSVRIELIRALPRHSILLLRAAVAEQLSSGLDEFQFHILLKQYRLQCNVANITPVSTSAAYRNAMEMCSERLLVAASGTGSMSRRFRLGMTTHDIQFAFKQIDESFL